MFWKKEFFRKPKWLRPELNIPLYYVHLVLISVSVFTVLQYVFGVPNMLTVLNVIYSIPLLTIGDGIAHTILQLD